ncbi:hypothetical protein ACTWQB_00755 [Piscibacillus sp. B03]|uniref:hypothetical protein n=1 Tax=Piscibacillus sp. B03 TaxID=3457430 RepID=UPI003FCCD136
MFEISESISPFKVTRIILTISTIAFATLSLIFLILFKMAITPIQVAMHWSLGLLMGVQAIEMVKMKKEKYVPLFALASLLNVFGATYILWLYL